MKLYDTEGNLISIRINPKDYEIRDKSKSGVQKEIGVLLKNRFPMCIILEEWQIPGKSGMTFDFIVLPEKLAIEVQGRQHYDFVKHFHRNIDGFKKQKERDKKKKEWCNVNGFSLYEIENESDFINAFGEKNGK